MYIFALLPYSKESKSGDNIPWHIVIFNKWINTGKYFPIKWKTNFSYDTGYFSFTCNWLKPNSTGFDDTDKYFAKYIMAPWIGRAFERGFYINDTWIWSTDISYEGTQLLSNMSDKYVGKFSFMDEKEKVEATATLKGEARRYAPECLKFLWLKRLYCKLFKKEVKDAYISFSTELGPQRGSWKGGAIGVTHPFVINLMFSWLDFKAERLQEIIDGK